MSSELRGSSFLIVGAGREGQSVYAFLRKRFPEARIGIADRHSLPEEFKSLKNTDCHEGPNYLSQCGDYDTIIRSPGVSIREIARHSTSRHHVTSATNIFFSECPGVTIGVTGTKGKSTTASLVASILKRRFSDTRLVGNIGTPMLDHLVGATASTHFVVELSSYQLEDLRISPRIAILLNIVPEHLDYHEGFEAYCAAKSSIFLHQKPSDLLIYNPSFEVLAHVARNSCAKHQPFSEHEISGLLATIRQRRIVLARDTTPEDVIGIVELPIPGPGNLQNVLAAITCAAALGLDSGAIREGILSFKPLEHRLELVGEYRGIRFYNDSLSTIPEALAHAISALGPNVETVIAGGFDRGVDMTSLGPIIANSNVKTLILFPTTGEKIWEAVNRSNPCKPLNRLDVTTMEDAVSAAYAHTSRGRICVLSPAASSFSVFRDYRERGDKFKEAVRALASAYPST